MANYHMRALLLGVLATFGSTACTEGSPATGDSVSRDSAGIRITESLQTLLPESSWEIGGTPILSIGRADGDSTQELYRVMGALRLAPDTLLIVNGGTAEVRWYDGEGQLIRSAGRQGAGPGEFSELGVGSVCLVPNGDLLVGDPLQQRANVFTRSGEFVRVVQVLGDAAFPSIQGCFSDGTLLAWWSVGPTERVPGTLIRSQFTWSRLDSAGTPIAELASLPSAPQYLLDQGDGQATYHTIPFTARPSAAASASFLYVAPGAEPEIVRYGLDGSVGALLRWEPTWRVNTVDVYDRYRASVLESQASPERRSYWAKFFDLDVEMPDQVAAVESLLVDDSGHVWAQRYLLPWDSVSVWDVFDSEGRWVVEVHMPGGFAPLQIGADFVVGLARDEMGVERVELRRLERGA